jgi:regulatory protein
MTRRTSPLDVGKSPRLDGRTAEDCGGSDFLFAILMRRMNQGSTGSRNDIEGRDRESGIRRKALRLLAVRERSRQELLDRLGPDAGRVVDQLADVGLQDDRRFAEEWARSGVARLHGPIRVRRELLKKGVAEDVVDSVIAEAYGGSKERELAEKAAAKHSFSLAGKEPRGRARTMYAYLVRRGFATALAAEVAKEEMSS